MNQAATIGYEGALAKALKDADLGFPLAVVAGGVLYCFLRRWELARYKR